MPLINPSSKKESIYNDDPCFISHLCAAHIIVPNDNINAHLSSPHTFHLLVLMILLLCIGYFLEPQVTNSQPLLCQRCAYNLLVSLMRIIAIIS